MRQVWLVKRYVNGNINAFIWYMCTRNFVCCLLFNVISYDKILWADNATNNPYNNVIIKAFYRKYVCTEPQQYAHTCDCGNRTMNAYSTARAVYGASLLFEMPLVIINGAWNCHVHNIILLYVQKRLYPILHRASSMLRNVNL